MDFDVIILCLFSLGLTWMRHRAVHFASAKMPLPCSLGTACMLVQHVVIVILFLNPLTSCHCSNLGPTVPPYGAVVIPHLYVLAKYEFVCVLYAFKCAIFHMGKTYLFMLLMPSLTEFPFIFPWRA